MTISIDTLKEAVQIKEQIAALEAKLQKILGHNDDRSLPVSPAKKGRPRKNVSEKTSDDSNHPWASTADNQSGTKKRRRKMSAAARAKIAAAQRARWAKAKAK